MKKMARFLSTGLLSVALVAVLAGCGGNKEVTNEKPFDGTKLKITASNFKFDQPEYRVKAGEPVEISLEVESGVHGISIQGAGVSLDEGESEVVTLKAGEYTIVCSIPCGSGHSLMRSKLIVT